MRTTFFQQRTRGSILSRLFPREEHKPHEITVEEQIRWALRKGKTLGYQQGIAERKAAYYNMCDICGAARVPVFFEGVCLWGCPRRHEETHRTDAMARLQMSQPLQKLEASLEPFTPKIPPTNVVREKAQARKAREETMLTEVNRAAKQRLETLSRLFHQPLFHAPQQPIPVAESQPLDARMPTMPILPHLSKEERQEAFSGMGTLPRKATEIDVVSIPQIPEPPKAEPVQNTSALEEIAALIEAVKDIPEDDIPTKQVPIAIREKIIERERSRQKTIENTLGLTQAEHDLEELMEG